MGETMILSTPRPWASRRRRATFAVAALVAAVAFGWLYSQEAEAQNGCESGDDRATCVEGNVTTCEGAELTASNILFVEGANNGADENVSGTVSGDGTLLNVTLLNPNVQIVGIVVKGGDNYNLYTSNVPDMHSPLVGQGNTPEISHWFVCYNIGTPGPTPGGGAPTAGAPAGGAAGPAGPVTARPSFTG